MRSLAAVILLLGLLAVPQRVAPQTAKTVRVAALGLTPSNPALQDVFRQGIEQVESTEARQLVVFHRDADGVPARLPALAQELAQARVDVIFARGPGALAAAARATTTIPIVAIDLESDPIALGFAKTLARPGGNVTGVFLDLPELSAKLLQLLRELAPGLSRVALVGDSTGNAAQFRATERAAKTLGVQAQALEGRTATELDAALVAARRSGNGAVLIFSSPLVFANVGRIAALAQEKRLPAVSLFSEFAEAGGLLSYGPNIREAFRRCGVYVGRILNGSDPAQLPIERPEKFELAINMKTAKALGLTIPPSLLLRADQVIER